MLQDVLNDSVVQAVRRAAIMKQQPEIVLILREVGDMLTPICVVAIIFGAIFAILRLYLRTKHEQRMLMIEKGMVEAVKNVREPKQMAGIAFAVLGFGVGWAIGALLSDLVVRINDIIVFPLACGFAAVGYLVYYFMFVWKKENKREVNS